ncbi:hypothetical protein PybrP1_011362 [[Pythium] brassicae (nom. inval.)]|nr:hypothetical protein PybrP1_011362 [[Pythium] brassicae (nom. inval.)]
MYMRSDFAALRVRKDVNELAKAKFTCSQAKTRVDFPDGANNMLRLIFTIAIADVAGPYANGDFTFFVEIPKTYPFHVWHPNIDVESGRVMMPILGKDWSPVLSINTVLLGLQLIFLEPGIDNVQNPAAAEILHADPVQFKKNIQQILCGGKFFGVDFPAHPRQLEKRRQSWGLRVKRARDEDSDCDVENASMLCPGASAELVHLDANAATWKRKRRE